jgi:cell division protein FtsB
MFSYSNKIFPAFLIALLIFLQYRLWFQAEGILDMLRLKRHLSIEMQENAQLKKRNDLLLQQVQKLQNNNDSIESRARHELGMIKKGETFYQVVE